MLRYLLFSLLRLFRRDPRGIFEIWDGRRWKSIDPIPAARALLVHPHFSWESTPFLTDDSDPKVQADAFGICASAAREAFGLRAFEEGGLTEAECCRVLWSFAGYLAAVKKNGSGPLMSPDSMGQPLSAASATNADSGSGLTGTAPDGSEPGTSCSEALPPDQMV